jgi:ABC-type multidrug transport system ATPase subunit
MPGQFLSIIGASGAGKTTLLNYLSGRLISRNLEKSGTVLINGVDRAEIKGFQSFTAFVQQDDIMFQTLTVRECLEFSAKLKLKGTYNDKMARVDQIIDELRLRKCQNTKIGGPLVKGVSGGERKRCSIGVELITDPFLIFLDEPTTGLDSFTATSVIETLRELAEKKGKTIVQTIHQPNSDMFEIFDRLMLLARGKIIYFNEAKLAVDYFANIGYKCPEMSNPADYFMSIMSYETIEQELDDNPNALSNLTIPELYAKRIKQFSDEYQKSSLVNDPEASMPGLRPLSEEELVASDAGWFYQFGLLAKRNFTNIMRLPMTSYVKLIVTVMTALFCVLLFNGVKDLPWYAGVQNRRGALFFITMTMAMNAIQNVILIFPDERPVFLREANNNMYKVSAYFWAKIVSEFPSSLLTPVVFGSIVYYIIGLNDAEWKFLTFLGILFLIYNAASGYSLIIGTMFSDKQLAVTLTPVLIIPFMLFAGFFVS